MAQNEEKKETTTEKNKGLVKDLCIDCVSNQRNSRENRSSLVFSSLAPKSKKKTTDSSNRETQRPFPSMLFANTTLRPDKKPGSTRTSGPFGFIVIRSALVCSGSAAFSFLVWCEQIRLVSKVSYASCYQDPAKHQTAFAS